MTAFKWGIILVGIFALSACGKGDSDSSYQNSDRVFLEFASAAELYKNTVSCETGKCVILCHVPPGEPENQQTLQVAIEALQAHLDHATETENDYLGECVETPDPTPTPEPTPEPTPTPEPSPTPIVCNLYPQTDRDQNCDGYDDVTGEFLY